VLSFYRRRIKETRRFEEVRAGRVDDDPKPSMLVPWRPKYRRNLVMVGLIHMLRSIPVFGSTAWWAFYAERERGFTSGQVAFYIICAYGLGCVGYYVCGRAMERFGRKPTGLLYGIGGIVFTLVLFQTTSMPLSFVSLLLAVFFGLGMAPVMSAIATELFPTEIRGQAAAWVRNVFEIAGYVFGPAVVGVLGDHQSGAIGNIGDTVTALMLLEIPCLYLVWRYLPETKGTVLEDAA
jgi:putative MFS transporter